MTLVEDLTSSELKYLRQIADIIDAVFWLADAKESRILYVSPAYDRIWGRDRQRLYTHQHEFFESIHPDDRERVRSTSSRCVLQERFEVEYRVVRPDGEVRWVRARCFLMRERAGVPYQVAGFAEDITQYKQTELAFVAADLQDTQLLRELGARLVNEGDVQTLYQEILFAAIALMRADAGTVQILDEATQELLLLATHGFERNMTEHFYRVNASSNTSCGIALKNGLRTFVDFDVPESEDPDGSLRMHVEAGYLCAQSTPLVTRSGKPIGMFSTHWCEHCRPTDRELRFLDLLARQAADLIEQRQTQAALRENEDRFRMALESAQLGTWDWNLSTHRLIWDENCKAMFGLPPEAESSIEVFFAGLHPDDRERLEQVIQVALNPASGGKYNTEYRTIGIQDGIERWITARGQVYFDSANNPKRFVGTVLNITEQKRIEVEREQLLAREQAAREEAENVNRIKDEFLAVLSHELRSPLNPILGWSKLLQNHKLDEAKTQQALKTIERNAQLQSELIEDLLDVSRILQGKLNLNVEPLNLPTVIQGALETIKLAAEAKSIQVEVNLDPEVGQVLGDATRLQQVVWNLLSNAVKFTPVGGWVEMRLESVENQAQIAVCDNGKGITPEFLPHVFDYFRQEDGATTRKFGGLGLGLAIVRQIVELHGGTIRAKSHGVGLGATFTVRLPLMPIQSSVNPNPDSPSFSGNLNGIQVLIVDDDADSRDFIAFVVEQAGASASTTASATEAIATLMQSHFDVLLSDIGMPEMDGYMLMQQVRLLSPKQGGQVKAIALTAYAGDFNRQQALQAGFQQHLSKPVDPEVLVKAIVNLTSSGF
ncbi:PAS domain-containing protein [Scytonema sp. NUACC26]|uniref:PAS domain-containing protein n=1 Tax=Scytonema sp. NUACC26 TaxID=3140176 RepID=UPI0034DB8B24